MKKTALQPETTSGLQADQHKRVPTKLGLMKRQPRQTLPREIQTRSKKTGSEIVNFSTETAEFANAHKEKENVVKNPKKSRDKSNIEPIVPLSPRHGKSKNKLDKSYATNGTDRRVRNLNASKRNVGGASGI